MRRYEYLLLVLLVLLSQVLNHVLQLLYQLVPRGNLLLKLLIFQLKFLSGDFEGFQKIVVRVLLLIQILAHFVNLLGQCLILDHYGF